MATLSIVGVAITAPDPVMGNALIKSVPNKILVPGIGSTIQVVPLMGNALIKSVPNKILVPGVNPLPTATTPSIFNWH